VARRLLLDLRPLRESPEFRRLTAGSTVSTLGGQMTTFAVALQVFRLTHSSAAVGGVGLAAFVPSVVVGLLGGPLIDSVDRRRLVLVLTCGLALVSAGFAAQAFAGSRSVWLLYGLVALQYLLGSLNQPAQRTFAARLLRADLLPAGAALSMLSMYLTLVTGPPLAGVLTGVVGLGACYLVDAVSYLAAVYGVARLPPMHPEGACSGRGPRAVAEGLVFIVGHRPLLGALISDLAATVLAFPLALFPAINAERFGGSPHTLALLSAAVAVGGILGTTFSGRVSRTARYGRGMLVATIGWGGALIGFGLVQSLAASCACLAAAGASDVLSVVLRTSLVQTATPDAYRGRVSAAEHVIGAGGPELGNFRAGVVGSLTSPGLSAVIGGACSLVATAALGIGLPALRRYAADSRVLTPGEPAPDGVTTTSAT
jgi:MFS family permease